jgi:N-methylhydantoinase B
MSDQSQTGGARRADDPILTSIIANRLRSIGERMGVVVERSARSPLLVEGRDFSVGIYDVDGTLVEQTEYIPVLGYATTPGMRAIAERFVGKVEPGDAILHNDPYSGGNQLSDWKVTKPVFHDGEHVAWVVIVAHQADIGGAVPGTYNPNATDMWQEGLRIPPVKIIERGERRADVWELIFGNVRLDIVADDVDAMIGACTVGEREMKALLAAYGTPAYRGAVAALLDAAERSAAEAIRRIEDGTYRAELTVHDDGIDHDGEWTIRLEVRVTGERIAFDFAGTDAQATGYINTPRAVTISSVMIAFFMIAEGEIPHNDGVLRRIEVLTPSGTLVNPEFPAPTCFGNHVADQLAAVIMLALAPAVPGRVTAGWNALLASTVNGTDPRSGRPYVDILLNACKGGGGGTEGADGFDHIGLIGSGGAIAAQDPEMFELVNPHLLHRYEYMPDSAGAGKWRGGLGVITELEFLDEGAEASIFGDGDLPSTAAFGLFGGGPGSVNEIDFTYPDGRVHRPHLKDLVSGVPRGTVYRQVAGGGGGYGDPHERDRETVRRDLRNGVISADAARELYGLDDE